MNLMTSKVLDNATIFVGHPDRDGHYDVLRVRFRDGDLSVRSLVYADDGRSLDLPEDLPERSVAGLYRWLSSRFSDEGLVVEDNDEIPADEAGVPIRRRRGESWTLGCPVLQS